MHCVRKLVLMSSLCGQIFKLKELEEESTTSGNIESLEVCLELVNITLRLC